MRSFQPPEFYFNNLKDLESAWSLVDSQPKYMDAIQTKLHCCGLFNSHDYAFKRLSIPDSCYTSNTEAEAEAKNLVASIHQLNNIGCLETVWYHNKFIVHRHVAFNWTLLITELVTFIYAIILSILIFKRRQRSRSETLHHTVVVRNYAHQINSSSRQLLLSH